MGEIRMAELHSGGRSTAQYGPLITSTGGGSATVGASYTTYVQATDVDNHSLTYSLSFGPVGATIDSQTGQLTWTPSTTGVSQFSVVVTDALGLSLQPDI